MGMIVGITGKAGAGKDTLADYLVANHNFIKLSWATPLKAALSIMGFPEPSDREAKELNVPGFDFTWREAAQTLGTEWGRNLDPLIWVKLTCQKMLKQPDRNFVLADVRFENEADALRRMQGRIVHLFGREADLGKCASHKSEQGIQFNTNTDIIMDNSRELKVVQFWLERSLGLPNKVVLDPIAA